MNNIYGYVKPCMTNLPWELGKAIIEQIRNSPPPDREKLRVESRRIVKENLEVRMREIAEQDRLEND